MLAIHKNAPHPNAAKLLIEFAISSEGQQTFVEEGMIPADSTMKIGAALAKELEGVTFFPNAPQILARETSQNVAKWKERIQKVYQ